MLFIENQGDLNCINDQGQTPLAFCNKYTLKTLDLEKGIVSVNPRNAENLNFDNNKLLFKYKGYEIKFPNRTDFKFNNISDYTNEIRTNNSELCCFNKEKKKTDMSILSSPIQN